MFYTATKAFVDYWHVFLLTAKYINLVVCEYSVIFKKQFNIQNFV